jgi:hypothetical protein
MPELNELLTEYVDERTPEQAPPFTQVQSVVRRQRRRRSLTAIAMTALVVGGVAVATAETQRADDQPATPSQQSTVRGVLDDGPPPETFKVGTTLLVLDREIPIVTAAPDPNNTAGLIVQASRDDDETCLPHTVVRILAQDAQTVRIAAYRYSVAPDQPETQQCLKPGGSDLRISLDLRRQLGSRKVLAGTTGTRSVLN